MKALLRTSLEEVCTLSGENYDTIIHFIEEEWVIPQDPERKYFDDEDLHRVKLISDLIHVLGVNEEAVPVILHLIDQLHALRRFRVEAQP